MALDVDHLATTGQLQPGQSGTCLFPLGNIDTGSGAGNAGSGAAVVITLRAKVGRLILSWRRPHGAGSGDRATAGAESDAGADVGADVGVGDVGVGMEADGVDGEEDGDREEEIIPIELVRHPDGGHRFYFRCPGAGSAGDVGESDVGESDVGESDAGCGRRVARLYFSRPWGKRRSPGTGDGRHRFLCRHCSGLIYVGPFESPRQRALRRANRLWQRLAGSLACGTEGAAEAAKLIAEALQAETQATEVHTAHLQRLIAWLDNRSGYRNRKPEFTL
jgi:hypothetical protein